MQGGESSSLVFMFSRGRTCDLPCCQRQIIVCKWCMEALREQVFSSALILYSSERCKSTGSSNMMMSPFAGHSWCFHGASAVGRCAAALPSWCISVEIRPECMLRRRATDFVCCGDLLDRTQHAYLAAKFRPGPSQ